MKKTLLTLFSIACVGISVNSQTVWADKVTIDSDTGNNPFTIASGLIDDDTHLDVLVGTDVDHVIVWYKGNGDGTFTKQTPLTNTLQNISSVKLADLNGDGFNDIIATGYGSYSSPFGSGSKLVWFANDATGTGSFGPEQIITEASDGMSGLFVGNIDAGTTPDIAVASIDSNEVLWYSNDGFGSFGAPNVIDNTLSSPGVIDMKDIDGDGDLDAVVGTTAYSGDVIKILRNDLVPGGTVAFNSEDATTVTTGKAGIFSISFEDLDGDTNLDILATELYGNLYWYEDNGSGFTENIFTTTTNNPSSAQAKDLDNDGLDDIILSSGAQPDVVDLVWFKNKGVDENNVFQGFGDEQIINDQQSQVYFYDVADFDGDNDLDIASMEYNGDKLNFIENLIETLSISAFENQSIKIFPNPTKDILNFEGFNTASIEISIFDILGKRVMEKSINNGETINVSRLRSGVYMIKINNEITSKFIKE